MAFAVAYHNLMVRKIHVFHPQAQTLHQAQAGTVQEGAHDPWGARQVPQHRRHLVLG
jgi:hypothetical protein